MNVVEARPGTVSRYTTVSMKVRIEFFFSYLRFSTFIKMGKYS